MPQTHCKSRLDTVSFIKYTIFINLVKAVILLKQREFIPKMAGGQLEAYAMELLKRILEGISVVKRVSSPIHKKETHDFIVDVCLCDGHIVRITVSILSNGEKGIVKNAISRLRNTVGDSNFQPSSVYNVIMAPYVSPASINMCSENNVGCMDFCGNCLLRHASFYVRISGAPNKYIQNRSKKNYLARRSVTVSKVLRQMLTEPNRYWQINELAKEAGASLGSVSNVKQFLIEKDWLTAAKKQFRIGRAGALLKEWAYDYNKSPNVSHEYYTMDTIPQVEKKMAGLDGAQGTKCILASFAAAVRYSPSVRYNKISAYVRQEDIESVVSGLGLKAVPSGGNINLIIPYDECVISHLREISGAHITSPVQTVLDLYLQPGRGEEAADSVIAKEFGNYA